MAASAEQSNPIGEKYSLIVSTYLEAHVNRQIDDDLIEQIGSLLAATTCELAGVSEAADILGVSKQRINQLVDRMPPLAGEVRATPLWLAEEVREFGRTRKPQGVL